MITKDELIALGVDEAVAREVTKKVASNKIEFLKDYVPVSKLTKQEEDNVALREKLKATVGEDVQKQLEEKEKEIEELKGTIKNERIKVQTLAFLEGQKRKPIPEAMDIIISSLALDELELDEKGSISEKELKKRYEDVVKTKSFCFQPEEGSPGKRKFSGIEPPEGKEGDSGLSDIDAFLSPLFKK